MLRKHWASSHTMRVGVFGLFAIATAAVFTTDSAEARRSHRHSHSTHARSHHNDDDGDYSPQFSSIIVDANSGATLTSTSPDGQRHPASLTKIMTLYLLFERLESGRMNLDTEMPVSEHASDQAPTKLGLRPGQSIRVEDAIKGLVTRSANDAAVVIAESIGGDEDSFAKMMTRKARALGMSRTLYRNASGLPNDEQVTTARDQALLGIAIQQRFPKFYRYFSLTSFVYRGNAMRNHNHLLGRVEGVDGIKTGYTNASGFNLVTSVKRGYRHIVAVVLGGRSAGSRDARMRELINQTMADASSRPTMALAAEAPSLPAFPALFAKQDSKPTAAEAESAPALAATAAIPAASDAPIKPVKVKTFAVKLVPSKTAAASAMPAPSIAETAAPDPPATWSVRTASLFGSSEPEAPTLASAPSKVPDTVVAPVTARATVVAKLQTASVKTEAPRADDTAMPSRPSTTRGGWAIQVGAYEDEGEAKGKLSTAKGRVATLFSKAEAYIERTIKGAKTYYRARFAGFDRNQAQATCKRLKSNDIECMALKL